ncbi:DUF4262 domain-containing protein [Bradyrhizobium sp. WSM1743]|uniref:DUF4262 domain-containing protein n=1 Tax=Bradyrhizobium sp. WSM1743 TaxID=318996 RepID=UPI0004183E9C|nr:DUF4262 domain-containing protein [Bradyrhizobium sp. WSM1743]
MQEKFEWPEPEHEVDKIILRNVRNHGCHIVGIPDADPPFAFSIGLFVNYGHPELIIFGQRPENAQAIINLVRDRVADGHKFVDGDISGEFLENDYKLGFWQVPFKDYPEYLGTAIWFYSKSRLAFPCLQVIWQDVNRRFPWEAGCSLAVKQDQPLLKKTVS